ncbi:MAG: ribonuclease HI [Firmicutes bacterium]|nr:ribonuclease HI [Bacillota bacterium]
MKVIIYTDGACSGNPGAGGWAAILMYGGRQKEISGGEEMTTNNRMELQAAIEGLKALKKPCEVELYSDSAYLVNAFNLGWIDKWRRYGWRKTPNATELIKNSDQWEELYELTQKYNTTFVKVKGHSDNEYNNRCDKLAVAAIPKNLHL